MSETKPHVTIIGGGLAGLATAISLVESNLRVTLLEARQQTGGRAGSFVDSITGSSIDYCQHVGMGCCTNLLDFLRKTQQIQDWEQSNDLLFIGPDNGWYSFRASPLLPAPLHLISAFKKLTYLTPPVRNEISSGIWKLMRQNQAQISQHETMESWLRAAGQSQEAIKGFWDVILVSALGERTDRVAVSPSRKVLVDGFLANRDASSVWIPQKPLSYLFGKKTLDLLSQKNVEVRTGTRVREVTVENEQAVSVMFANEERLKTDFVVTAVPWHQLRRTLGPASNFVPQIDDIVLIPPSAITGIHLWCDRPLTNRRHIVFVGRTAQWLFRPEFIANTPNRYYHQVVISATHELNDRSELVKRVFKELKEALPDCRDAELADYQIVRDPNAVFSVSNQTEKTRPPRTTRLRNLWLAGDWTKTGWPATMESAIISGYRAGELVLQSLGVSKKFEVPPLRRSILLNWLIRDH